MAQWTNRLRIGAAMVGVALVAACAQPAPPPPPPPQAAAPMACKEFMVHFDTGSVLMHPMDRTTINSATLAASNPAYRILLIGKTDTVGSKAANMQLSKRRADAVYHALVDNGALPTHIVRTYTGKAAPVVATGDQEANQMNRTVIIKVGEHCHV